MTPPTVSDFNGYSDNYAIPSGVPDPIFTGSVNIIFQLVLHSKFLIV